VGSAVGLLLFFWRLGSHDLWPSDEPRFGLQAWEMRESGEYIVPSLNGQPNTEKPPLLFWAINGFALFRGEVDEWAARLPSAVSSLLTLFLIYQLGAWLYDRRAGLFAALIFATSLQILVRGRWASIDMLLTLLVLVAIVFLWAAATRGAGVLWSSLAWACMGLAVLAKGPIGVLLPLMVVVPPLLLWRDWPALRRVFPIPGIILCAVVTLSWYVPLARAVGLDEVFRAGTQNNVTRFLNAFNFKHPWYYYLWRFPVGFLPWIFFLPWAARDAFRNGEGSGRRRSAIFLSSWFATIFVFFSIASGKRGVYIIPLYPAAAILIGALFARATGEGAVAAAARRRLRLPAALWVGLATVLAIALPLAARQRLPEMTGVVAVVGGILFAGAAAALVLQWKGRSTQAAATLVGSMVLLSLVSSMAVVPWLNERQNIRGFAETVRPHLSADTPLASTKEKRDAWVFYTARIAEEVDTEEQILAYLAQPGPRDLIIDEPELRDLRDRLPPGVVEIVRETVGTQQMYLLRKEADASAPQVQSERESSGAPSEITEEGVDKQDDAEHLE